MLEATRDYTLEEIIWYLGLNLDIFKWEWKDDARYKHIVESFALFLQMKDKKSKTGKYVDI